MKRLLSHLSLVLLFLFTLSVNGTVHAAEIKTGGQVAADQIASFTNKAIYNLDHDQLLAVLESFLEERPEIQALTITESIDQERLLTYFRQNNNAVYDQPVPEELLKLKQFSSVSMFDGEKIGTVEIYYINTSSIPLSTEEQEWIKDHPRVRVHNEMAWPPFNFTEDGKPQGFSIDVMNLLAKKTGLEVEYVTGPTWNEFLKMMKNGDLDVMLNIVKTPERQKYLLYTPPYANNPNTILSQRESTYKSIEQLFGKTVAVPKGFFYEEILKRDFPQIKVLAVKNMLESMKAVSFGNADAAFGELAVFSHLMAQHIMTDLVVSGDLDWGNPELTLLNIATRKDLPILASILTKAVNAITKEEKREIRKTWLGGNQAKNKLVLPERAAFNQADFIIQYIAIIFAVILAIVFTAWLARGRPKNFTIRETLFAVFFIFVGLIISIGTLVTMLLEGEQEQSKIEVRNNESFSLALELKQSSDDLTRFARIFSVTGDPIYEKYYQTIISIRDGKRPHPKEYTRSYWDQVIAGIVELDEGGEVYSIEQRMIDLGFSEDEGKKLSQAKKKSDGLINLETASMNAVHGRFQDADGKFSLEGNPNLEMARQLLHGQEYHDAKASIMRPIDDFFILLEWRITNELNLVRERNKAIILAITALTVITISFAFYAFFLLKRRIITPLSLLEEGTLTLKDGDYSNRVDISSEDEIGTLAKSFNSMASGIEERTKEVAEKEKHLRLAMDNMPGGMFLVDHDQNFLLFNHQYSELFDFPEGLIAEDKPLLDMIHFQAQRGDYGVVKFVTAVSKMMRLFSDEQPHHYERQLQNGSILEVNLAPTPDGGTVAVVSDITERKLAENELRKSEQTFKTVVDQLPNAVMLKDLDGRYLLTNNKFDEWFAQKGENIIGKTVYDILPKDVSDQVTEMEQDVIKTRQLYQEEISQPFCDGNIHSTIISKFPIIGPDEQVVAVGTVDTDITERKKDEEQLQDAFGVITSSINYASRIQRSILPDDSIFSAVTQDQFVLWKPRDVVGGDLYWHGAWGNGCLIILGDCTGHGVPGAFMTLIVIGALERAMSEIDGGEVDKLISRVHQYIQVTLSQHSSGGDSDDGIELGACYFVPDEPNMIFVGTRFELHINDGSEISTVKGTKQGMGYRGIPYTQEYAENVIDLKPEQSFYLTTDGLIDQVGGERKRMYGKKRFKELLTSIQSLPMSDQKQEIYKSLLNYQGDENRRDDVAVIGFKV